VSSASRNSSGNSSIEKLLFENSGPAAESLRRSPLLLGIQAAGPRGALLSLAVSWSCLQSINTWIVSEQYVVFADANWFRYILLILVFDFHFPFHFLIWTISSFRIR
jgi:hypothetical protein